MAGEQGGAILKEVHTLFRVGTTGARTDGELLEQFSGPRGEHAEAAFEVLVDRHGPMVLKVCQGVLRDPHDAQDAFQATFLVLARRAAAIRKRDSVGSWLHGVALRVASRAKVELARRRALERRSAEMAARSTQSPGPAELLPELHEEVSRLPEHYREAVVLCYLEGLTYEEAASQLRWPVGTVKIRLSRARELLKGRFTRRGLVLPAGLAGAVLVRNAAAAIPETLRMTTVQAAVRIAAGETATVVATAQVAALTEGVITTMFMSKLKAIAAALLISMIVVSGGGVLAQQAARGKPRPGQAAAPRPEVNPPPKPEVRQPEAVAATPPFNEPPPATDDPAPAVTQPEREPTLTVLPDRFQANPARPAEVLGEEPQPAAERLLAMAGPAQDKPKAEQVLGDEPDIWEVKPDPPSVVPPALTQDIALRVPDSFGQNDVVYPTAPSVFVAVGGNGNRSGSRQIWDLASRKRVGALRGEIRIEQPFALSPDGALFAAKTGGFDRGFAAFDTKTSRLIAVCKADQPFADFIDFVGPEWLITGECGKPLFQVWNLKTQQVALTITPPERVAKEAAVLSPGRKYLAMVSGSKLLVYDVSNGKLVGDANVPKHNNNFELRCEGLAFSPDGKELAGVFDAFGAHVVCWDVGTSQITAKYDYDDKSGLKFSLDHKVGAIDWLGDKSGWLLYGQFMVERQTGQKIYTIPNNTDRADTGPRKVFGTELVLITVGDGQQKMVRSFKISKETLANAAKIVREGGSATDAILPPLKTADTSSARQVTPESNPGAWSVTPNPAAAGKTSLSRRALSLRSAANEPQRLLFADLSAAQVAVVCLPGGFNPFDQNQNEGKPREVHRYDLANGKLLGRTQLPGVTDPIAVSPDGNRVLMVDIKERGRVDVFDMATDKHIAGWRPYGKESGDDRAVAWAAFLKPDQVLTTNKAGTLILWSLPDCKAVYVAEAACEGAPALSPGRKLLATYLGGTVRLLDAATGAVKGEGATPGSAAGGRTDLKALAFSADGTALVALVNSDQIVRWDLASGKVTADFRSTVPFNPLPNNRNQVIECCGPNHVLLDGRILIDLAHRAHVWSYFGAEIGAAGPDGRHWFITFFGQPVALRAIALPETNVERVVAMVGDPNVKALLRTGSKVSVQLELTGPQDDPQGFRNKVAEQLNAKLRANDMKTGDGGPLWIVVHAEEKDTGRTVSYREFGDPPFSPPRHQMAIKVLECEVQLADSQSRIPLGPKQPIEMPSPFFLHLPPGEKSVEHYLRQAHWENVRGHLSSIGLPYFVARLNDGSVAMLPGVSNLNDLR